MDRISKLGRGILVLLIAQFGLATMSCKDSPETKDRNSSDNKRSKSPKPVQRPIENDIRGNRNQETEPSDHKRMLPEDLAAEVKMFIELLDQGDQAAMEYLESLSESEGSSQRVQILARLVVLHGAELQNRKRALALTKGNLYRQSARPLVWSLLKAKDFSAARTLIDEFGPGDVRNDGIEIFAQVTAKSDLFAAINFINSLPLPEERRMAASALATTVLPLDREPSEEAWRLWSGKMNDELRMEFARRILTVQARHDLLSAANWLAEDTSVPEGDVRRELWAILPRVTEDLNSTNAEEMLRVAVTSGNATSQLVSATIERFLAGSSYDDALSVVLSLSDQQLRENGISVLGRSVSARSANLSRNLGEKIEDSTLREIFLHAAQ
jgi:hypothetical protein